jgi:hypothetical protein
LVNRLLGEKPMEDELADLFFLGCANFDTPQAAAQNSDVPLIVDAQLVIT